ncbi:MAG: hypothetical protein A3A87_03000 [Candidatus Muproteobacteria bacterium RIFCSPLOWO2_01_FULL_60_18]|uniref:Uncharacterized protein n=1 Tax=Candidatus Muproteobacteria bacterium RIFCSPLOWO2_01_FULL_60_18 TaxID=1817768 RepID=A0A1F6U2C9_9PROT|nr:MAG: hypothetical protein A3A87_03000 [Candidatus Muproteobacteria bacterium RIFCSPLOWO2_01_FULL_60_18]
MEKPHPWVTGAALAGTLAVVYALYVAAFAIAAATTIDFFNAWFHGLNLAGLQAGAKPFTFGVFLYGVVGIAVIAFVCGVVFAASYNLLGAEGCHGH